MARFYLVVASFMMLTSTLIAVEWVIAALRLPGRQRIGLFYFRLLRRLLRVDLRVQGAPRRNGPVLIVANHVSWVDIPVIASVMPLVFVAKQEVRRWPLVGYAAELLHTIFVDRTRRQQTGEVNAAIARKMSDGDPVVLFAEGTSSDGNRVLQFRSALVGAASDVLAAGDNAMVWLQPVSISYPQIDGLPAGRQHRPLVAWYGDTDFVPHLKDFVRLGAVDAVVTFGEPVAFDGRDRKSVVKSLETAVRRMMTTTLRGENPAQAA